METECPCCGLGKPDTYPYSEGESLFDDFFSWLNVHAIGFKMRYDAMGWDVDWGYIKACEVIEAELRRKLEEYKDGDRIKGSKGLLDEEIS
jgi:hypothetical protein